MALAPDDLLIFKLRETEKKTSNSDAQTRRRVVAVQPKQAPAQNVIKISRERTFVAPTGSYAQVEEALETTGAGTQGGRSAKETRAQIASKEAATGLACVWHPWRPAYAVCDYCHRPFCFEDIVEHAGRYYCLEDIDEVTKGAVQELLGYGPAALIGGGLLAVTFVAFLYMAGGQIAYIINYANTIGFFAFVGHIQLSYVLTLLGIIVVLFELIAGALLLARAKSGFGASLSASLAGILFFSYVYLDISALYALVVSAVSIASLAALIVSTRTMHLVETEAFKPAEQVAALDFPNIGKF